MATMRCIVPAIATAVLLAASSPALAQIPGLPGASGAAAAEPASDPLGRDTPSGTILGFNRAVRREDFVSATMYMQLTGAQREHGETLARELNHLIDRYFDRPMSSLSTSRAGTANDGLPLDRERIPLNIEGTPYDILLVRIAEAQAGTVWLISSESLTQVSALYRSSQAPWLERMMPAALVSRGVFGLSYARWLAYLTTIALPLGGLWLLSVAFIATARRLMRSPARLRALELWYRGLRWLIVFILALGIHLTLVRYLGFTLRFRYAYTRLALAAAVVSLAWLLMRLLTLSMMHARLMALRRGGAGFSSLLMLAERVGKVIVTLVAIFSILKLVGVDTTTALAGVGIGGVAVALGAQKSVENLLGGVFLITDNVLAVGDQCRIADRIGWIEDITLRSVRLRTIDQTLLSIPAGVLSQASIENFTTRAKIPIHTTLRLRYVTTATQLRAVLGGVRRLLASDPDIETDSSRIRLVDFGAQAVELELFAYVMTADPVKFYAVREELLLRIAEAVESAGAAFAQPAEFVQPATPARV